MNCDRYPIINFQNWTFYTENPEARPIKVRNCLEKLDDATSKIEITDDKVRYVWSTQDLYNIAPIDALKSELTHIIETKEFVDDRDNNLFYCKAWHKFNVCKLNEGTNEEQLVVVFGKYEKQIQHLRAGIFFFAVGLGASCALPLLPVNVALAACGKVVYDAYKKNAVEFNPKSNIQAGFISGVSEFVTGGFQRFLLHWDPLNLSNSLFGRLTRVTLSDLVYENTETVLNGNSPTLGANVSLIVGNGIFHSVFGQILHFFERSF